MEGQEVSVTAHPIGGAALAVVLFLLLLSTLILISVVQSYAQDKKRLVVFGFGAMCGLLMYWNIVLLCKWLVAVMSK